MARKQLPEEALRDRPNWTIWAILGGYDPVIKVRRTMEQGDSEAISMARPRGCGAVRSRRRSGPADDAPSA